MILLAPFDNPGQPLTAKRVRKGVVPEDFIAFPGTQLHSGSESLP